MPSPATFAIDKGVLLVPGRRSRYTAPTEVPPSMSDTDRLSIVPAEQPTRSYDGVGTVRPAPLPAARGGAGTAPNRELQVLLRRRLSVLAVICLCVSLAFMGILTPFLIDEGS